MSGVAGPKPPFIGKNIAFPLVIIPLVELRYFVHKFPLSPPPSINHTFALAFLPLLTFVLQLYVVYK